MNIDIHREVQKIDPDPASCFNMFLASVVLLMASSLVPCLTVAQPHIVVIMADDLGWNDVGFHGSDQIPTPNIDALAYHGVILNRHYTMPTCTPSRTAFLTGKHPIRTGMQGFPLRAGEPRGIPLEERLLPERLAQLGYSTHLVGKWHVGAHRVDYTPTRRGFASHFGYWNGYIGYFDHNIQQGEFRGLDLHRDLNPTPENRGQYATDVFTREAVDIILSHDKSRPLYLQVAHLAVHSGNDTLQLEVPDVDATERRFSYITNPRRRLFAGSERRGFFLLRLSSTSPAPKTRQDRVVAMLLSTVINLRNLMYHTYSPGMLARLDESVGKIVEAMAERGMLDNSILVFLSDNGAQTFGLHTNEGSNWPLRGSVCPQLKFTLFEGGVRGTCAIWSPLIQQTGRVSSDLIHISDWLPTLYSAADCLLGVDQGLLENYVTDGSAAG
uniref:Sulfatase N-terminal domain-containing protein n=1 Tax=Timema genevievae TaxID=629358 RepID=A0A7R9JVD5_TIMGE|nr:unnamed protein product [Timema genevievae]